MKDLEKRLEAVADGEEMVVYSAACIENIIEDDLVEIFTRGGIPRFWTPDVDFLREGKGAFEKFKNYIVFAVHNDNMIALNEKKEVVMLDTECGEEKYIICNMKAFVYSLVVFNEIVLKIIEENPDCDYYAEYLTEDDIDYFRKEISLVDESAVSEDSFWNCAIMEIIED